ncbi:hypothetical protein KVR01_000804 [Diaporthe batatas]|uniref:uncharacterized protein n=1 Tax=Diaporthe batatas TaxID=748121 RepID=UPI001D0471E0|nr:uncharacterized protein KVR01_000804 [Diaporthe batatas]KAG8170059.1 hypothetical protein KVR01_000804 [Diaporthe batatas]
MFNQRRIYHFLEDVVNDIMAEKNEARFKVDQEHVQTQWQPKLPDPDSMGEEEYRQKHDKYLSVCRSIVPYKAMAAPMWDYATQIISRRIEIYEDRLQGLKAHPGNFLHYLFDMREHSHHVVPYSGDRIHPYANLDDNQNNGHMWALYLLRSLQHATEGLDFWRAILISLRRWQNVTLAAKDDTDEDDPLVNLAHLILLYVTVLHRVPMSETDTDTYIPLSGLPLAEEILGILQGQKGGSWMTNFGLEAAEEHHDSATVWALIQRYWQYHGLEGFQPIEVMKKLPDNLQWDEQLRPSRNLMNVNVDDLVAKYLIPYPSARFEYSLLSLLSQKRLLVHHLKHLPVLLGQGVPTRLPKAPNL